MTHLVIIGSGLAGYGLLREYRKREAEAPVTLVTADGGEVYAKPNLSNALAQGRLPAQLASDTAEAAAAKYRARVITRTPVLAIDPANRKVVTRQGGIPYAKLVLALGADPLPHGLAGSGLGRVHGVNDLDDYTRFRAALAESRRVAILGGGLIGCEFANDLAGQGREVSIVHRGSWPLDRLIPEPVGRAVKEALQALGVAWRFGARATAVEATGDGVELALDDGGVVGAELVLSAIGLGPRAALAGAAGLRVNRGIVVDRQLRTSDPDIHAIGDCAEVEGMVLPYVQPLLAQARTLAAVLAGEAARLAYPAMPVLVKTPACPLVVSPPPAGVPGEWRLETAARGLVARHVDGEGRLRGFVLTGGETGRRLEFAQQVPPLLA